METPSSTRRITRSYAALTKNMEDSEKAQSKSTQVTAKQQNNRSALIDITNDSPIVGVAMESPSSITEKKQSSKVKGTPGSGERLLRCQVKTLLQKIEEEAVFTKVSSMATRPFVRLVNSPTGLLAPTPANTPQICNSNLGEDGLKIVIASPVVEEHLRTSQMVDSILEEKKVESFESQESMNINRSLLLDFFNHSDTSDSPDSSEILSKEISATNPEDDSSTSSSLWSMVVNTSIGEKEDEEEDGEVCSYEEELSRGMWKMNLGEKKTMAEFAGKHIRFVYDGEDDEIVGMKEESSSELLRLNGLPSPKGKHFRFEASDEEEDAADVVLGI